MEAIKQSRGFWYWVPRWTFPVLVLFAMGTIWLRLYMVRTTYSINQADREIREHRQVLSQAELKVASQRSPKNLEAIAKQKFNLKPPKTEQYVPMQAPSGK